MKPLGSLCLTFAASLTPLLLASAAPAGSPRLSQPQPGASAAKTAVDQSRLAEILAPSLVRVEFMLQYDKGQSPGMDWASRFGGMRSFSSMGFSSNWDELITQERPAERAGYMLSDRRVVTSDILLHPRFIKEVTVRSGGKSVKAVPTGYGVDRNALFLELAEPLPGAKPLAFDAAKPGPYFLADFGEVDATWCVMVGPAESHGGFESERPSPRRVAWREQGLVVDGTGAPVGLTFEGRSPADDSWKGAPDAWPVVPEKEMNAMLGSVEEVAAGALARVSLGFRSPRSDGASDGGMFGGYGRSPGASAAVTQWFGSAVVLNPSTILVLANLGTKTTGRLETIRVVTPAGETSATFVGTLADYGGFIASLEKPLPTAARLFSGDVTDLADKLLVEAEVTVHGEIRTTYFTRGRIQGYSLGWRRHVYPSVDASQHSAYDTGDSNSLNFLFTPAGELVTIPIARREKVAVRSEYGWSEGAVATPTGYITEALADQTGRFDAQNRPVSEDEENRMAWLGVEMQPMDPDLARESNVTDQTRGGETGAIVTYIYPDSPAARAGVEIGDVLLRVHVESQPKPIDVEAQEDDGFGSMYEQLLESMDQMPAEYLDRMPKPWGSVETPLTRSLTDLGFGTPFKVEIFHEGKVSTIDFKVEESPAHYDSAKRLKSEAAGFTARDLTYEVRRFFQLQAEEPGVIVSKIESGEKAAVAGLKPYELIVAVNDKAIHNVGDLESVLAGGGEMRVSVKRMTTGRIVKFKIDPAKPEGEADPAAPK